MPSLDSGAQPEARTVDAPPRDHRRRGDPGADGHAAAPPGGALGLAARDSGIVDAHLSAFVRPAEGSGGAGALLSNKDRATRGGVRLSLPERRRSIALSALDLLEGPR